MACNCPCHEDDDDWEDDEDGYEFFPGNYETYDRDAQLLDHKGRPIERSFTTGFCSPRGSA